MLKAASAGYPNLNPNPNPNPNPNDVMLQVLSSQIASSAAAAEGAGEGAGAGGAGWPWLWYAWADASNSAVAALEAGEVPTPQLLADKMGQLAAAKAGTNGGGGGRNDTAVSVSALEGLNEKLLKAEAATKAAESEAAYVTAARLEQHPRLHPYSLPCTFTASPAPTHG